MLSSPGYIYIYVKTLPLPCTVVMCGEAGEGGDQDVAFLVLTGFGISVSEIFGVISEDSRCCV